MTVKKAFPVVKTKIDDLLGGLNSKLEEGRLLEEKCESHKKEIRENNKMLKGQISDLFNVYTNQFYLIMIGNQNKTR